MQKKICSVCIFFTFAFAVFAQSYSVDDLFEELKNISTIGYKGIDVTECRKFFRDLNAQGPLAITKKNFDFAIIGGNAFFKVIDPKTNKVYYTRNGRFNPNKDGYLALENGYVLSPKIKVNTKKTVLKTSIKEQELYITYDDGTEQKEKIALYDFENNSSRNEGLYFTASRAYEQEPYSRVCAGVLEHSTVRMHLTLLLLQNMLYKMRDEKNSLNYAEHQINWINDILRESVVFIAPDDVYTDYVNAGQETQRENVSVAPTNSLTEKVTNFFVKEFTDYANEGIKTPPKPITVTEWQKKLAEFKYEELSK